jgi:hypothetical protein
MKECFTEMFRSSVAIGKTGAANVANDHIQIQVVKKRKFEFHLFLPNPPNEAISEAGLPDGIFLYQKVQDW